MTEDRLEPEITEHDRKWAMACHLSAFFYVLLPFPLPGLNILGPLYCWIRKGRRRDFVSVHARESLAFQLPIALVMAAVLLYFWQATPEGIVPSRNLLVAISMIYGVHILFTIVATWQAGHRRIYRYPFGFRFFP